MRKSIGAAAGLTFSLILGACSGDAAVSGLDANTTMDAAGRTVVISAKALALLIGQSQQLTATAPGGGNMNWRSTDTVVAVVSKDGVVTARGAGSTKIVVSARGASDEATVTVTSPVTVASVVISPSNASLAVGESARPVATVLDQNGAAITGRTGTWASSAPSVASVDATGLVTAKGQGVANVTYTVDGKSGALAVNVQGSSSTTTQPAPVATVSVTLASSSLTVGGSTQASAVARDASGNVLTGRAVSWSSSNPSVATVTTSGLVTAVSAGSASIVAMVEGKTGSASFSATAPVTVAPAPTTGSELLASHGFEDGTLGPYTNPWGTGADIVADPTGSGRGKIVRLHYAGPANQDHNLGVFYSKPGGLGLGQTIFFRGDFYLPPGTNFGPYQMRKLIYWHRDQQTFPEFSSVITLYGPQMGVTQTVVSQSGEGRLDFKQGFASVEGGRWYTLEVQTTMNSSFAAKDGVFRIWLDGVLVHENLAASWSDPTWTVDPATQKFAGFGVGYQMQANEAYDEYRYWDNIAFSTNRIR